jgi:hypothetical protein
MYKRKFEKVPYAKRDLSQKRRNSAESPGFRVSEMADHVRQATR